MNDDFKERFDYLMSLSNNDLRKEIENSNWVFILQELRYAGETIEAYENMRKEAIEYIEDVMELTKQCPQNLLNILNKVGGSDE